MRLRVKLLVAASVLLGIVLAALLILPSLFRDRLAVLARSQIDRALAAHVDWSGLHLTFFRNFPNLTLGLDDLSVVGADRFEGDTLVSAKSFRVVLDAVSVVRGVLGNDRPVVVRSVRVEAPRVVLRVLEDGTANWDIAKSQPSQRPEPAGSAAGAGGVHIELRDLDVSDGNVVFDNARSGVYASLEGLRHTLSGDFSKDSLGVRSRTHVDRTTLRFAGTPWLAGVALDFGADIDADLANHRFAFRDNELRLNDLAIRFAGEAEQRENGLGLDMTFSAPGTGFAQVLSLVPAMYAHDFASLETSGTVALEGRINGTYADTTLPAFAVRLSVNDGMFRYPDLPLPARGIALDLDLDNPGGSADGTVVSLRRFHAELGGRPLDATLTLRTPVSDPDVDASVNGTLDLADVARTVKLENVDTLAGVVAADASVHARRSDVENERYDRMAANGTISARGIAVKAQALRQPLAVEQAMLRLSPRRAELQSFRATVGSSDLQATGSIENLPAFLVHHDALRGTATFHSGRFVLDEWQSDDPTLEVIPVPAMLDLSATGTIDRLVRGQIEMSDARGSVRVKDQRLTLDGFTVRTLGGRIGLNGYYETLDPSRPTFAVAVAIDSLDIHDAADALLTVRTLAPVAQFARGTFSANLDLSGALGHDLSPLFDVLDGKGAVLTSRIALEGFPMMQRLADILEIPQFNDPTFNAIRSNIEIHDGRLHVRPFRVGLGQLSMGVSGSNGIDQSLDYSLDLALPRAVMGDAADRLVQKLSTQAGRAGLNLAAGDSIRVGVRVTGSITDPTVNVGLGQAAGSVTQQAGQAVQAAVGERAGEAKERVDSARAEAVRRAQAQADSIVAEAQERADSIRAEAKRLADGIRAEGNKRADDVMARATNEIARAAARPVADRIRKEADDRATELERQAGERADAVVAEARRRADDLVTRASGGS